MKREPGRNQRQNNNEKPNVSEPDVLLFQLCDSHLASLLTFSVLL